VMGHEEEGGGQVAMEHMLFVYELPIFRNVSYFKIKCTSKYNTKSSSCVKVSQDSQGG